MLKAKASDHASRGDQFCPSEQRPQAAISLIKRALATVAARAAKRLKKGTSNAVRNDNYCSCKWCGPIGRDAAAGKSQPTFDLKSSTSMLQLVKSGGGGGMGGGGGGGGGRRLNLGGGGMGGHNGGVTGGGMGHMGHMGGGGDGHMDRMARGDFNGGCTVETLPTTETLPAITGMGIGIVTTISITGSLSEHRSSMAGITPITATATAPGCGGKPSSPAAPIGGSAIRPACTIRQS